VRVRPFTRAANLRGDTYSLSLTRCIVFLSVAAKGSAQGRTVLSMFERFTDRARRVVVLAQEERPASVRK